MASSKTAKCPVTSKECSIHGYVHGQEAEELRHGIEDFISSIDGNSTGYCGDELIGRLQHILDNIDARDSLAFLETAVSE